VTFFSRAVNGSAPAYLSSYSTASIETTFI